MKAYFKNLGKSSKGIGKDKKYTQTSILLDKARGQGVNPYIHIYFIYLLMQKIFYQYSTIYPLPPCLKEINNLNIRLKVRQGITNLPLAYPLPKF